LVGMCHSQGHNHHYSHLRIANDFSSATHPAPITVAAPLLPTPLVPTPVPLDQVAASSMSSSTPPPTQCTRRVVKRQCNAELLRNDRGETDLLLSCL
jgi:hypothetical protein